MCEHIVWIFRFSNEFRFVQEIHMLTTVYMHTSMEQVNSMISYSERLCLPSEGKKKQAAGSSIIIFSIFSAQTHILEYIQTYAKPKPSQSKLSKEIGIGIKMLQISKKKAFKNTWAILIHSIIICAISFHIHIKIRYWIYFIVFMQIQA